MTNRLYEMAGTMYQRTGIGEMMDNVWKNFQYTMASGIANNPVLYATYKIAGLLDQAVGGIPLPFINTFFGGIDLHTSVADLMRVAAMSGGILSGVGSLIANFSAGGGFNGKGMLNALGVSGLSTVKRGGGDIISSGSGESWSESGYVGNQDAGAVKDKVVGDANKDAQDQLTNAQESEDQDISREDLRETLVDIVDLLKSVIADGAFKSKDVSFTGNTPTSGVGTLPGGFN